MARSRPAAFLAAKFLALLANSGAVYYTVHTHHIVSNLLEIEVANYNAIGAKTEEKLIFNNIYQDSQ